MKTLILLLITTGSLCAQLRNPAAERMQRQIDEGIRAMQETTARQQEANQTRMDANRQARNAESEDWSRQQELLDGQKAIERKLDWQDFEANQKAFWLKMQEQQAQQTLEEKLNALEQKERLKSTFTIDELMNFTPEDRDIDEWIDEEELDEE